MNSVEVISTLTQHSSLKQLKQVCSNDASNNDFWHIPNNAFYRFRLLGPIIKARRMFVPAAARKLLTYDQVYRLSIKDRSVMEDVFRDKDKLNDPNFGLLDIGGLLESLDGLDKTRLSVSRSIYTSALEFANQVFNGKNWSKCAIVNALKIPIKEEYRNDLHECKLLVLKPNMLNSIGNVHLFIATEDEIKISGINACDITIFRRGEGLQTRYEAALSIPHMLDRETLVKTVEQGLMDVRKYINENLGQHHSGFLYRCENNYMLPETYFKDILGQIDQLEGDAHIESVDAHINDIPKEALGDAINITNPLSAIHL